MARKPLVTTQEPTPEIELRPDAADAANVMAAVQTSYDEERDLANQLWGQIQMADAIAKLTTVVGLTKLKEIKESKLYRAFSGKSAVDREGNKIPDVGTWEGFCRALGTSVNKVDEDLLNLRVFGEEAMENLSRIGAGYRDLRQFRKLPADQKTALIEAAKTGDKDTLLELAEDLIAKHAKEKEELSNQLAEIAADKEATERVAQGKEETINKLQREVVRLSNPLNTVPWDVRVAPFQKEITERQSILDAAIAKHLEAIQALDVWMTAELTSDPNYDPEVIVPLPPAVRAVVLHLDEAIQRTATLAAEMQNEIRLRFGADIDDARRHVLIEDDEA